MKIPRRFTELLVSSFWGGNYWTSVLLRVCITVTCYFVSMSSESWESTSYVLKRGSGALLSIGALWAMFWFISADERCCLIVPTNVKFMSTLVADLVACDEDLSAKVITLLSAAFGNFCDSDFPTCTIKFSGSWLYIFPNRSFKTCWCFLRWKKNCSWFLRRCFGGAHSTVIWFDLWPFRIFSSDRNSL